MKHFKIRDKNTGLFSKGGSDPQWSKKGKTWNSEGALKSHLTLYKDPGMGEYKNGKYVRVLREVPESWEVIVLSYGEPNQEEPYSAKSLADREPKK